MSLSLFLFRPDLKLRRRGRVYKTRWYITDEEKWYVFSYNASRKKINALSSILFFPSFFFFFPFFCIHTQTHECTLTHEFFFFFCLILRFFYNEPEFLNDEFIYIDTNNNGNGKKKFAVHENETQFFKMSFKLVSRESFDLYCFIFVRHLFPLKDIFLFFFFIHIYMYIYGFNV